MKLATQCGGHLFLTGFNRGRGIWAPPPGSATGYTTQAVSIELSQCSNTFSALVVSGWLNHDHFCIENNSKRLALLSQKIELVKQS